MTTSKTFSGRPDPDAVAVAQAVYEQTQPLQAVLFGSRARGTHRPDSDIDIAIITTEAVAEDARDAYDRIAEQAAAGHPETPSAHVAFLTVAKFLDERVRKNTVANNIAREGTPVIHEESAGYSSGFEEDAINWSDVNDKARDAQGLVTDLEIMASSGRASEKMIGYIAQQMPGRRLQSANRQPGGNVILPAAATATICGYWPTAHRKLWGLVSRFRGGNGNR